MARRSGLSFDPMTPALLAALRAQLADGERLAWAGSPEPSAIQPETQGIGKLDGVAIVGGGYATLGACVMAARSGQWLWLSIPIALVVLGSLGYWVARQIKARARRTLEGTVYGLSTRRAMIVYTYPALSVKSVPIHAIIDVTVSDKRGDFGELCLQATPASASLVFRGVVEPERACAKLMRTIRDPQGTDQELAASEQYAAAMRQLASR